MCQPDFYGIEYEINAWMHRDRPGGSERGAIEQWLALRNAIEDSGSVVETMPAVAGLPDLVFTANAGMVYRELAIVAHFRHPERQGEEAPRRALARGARLSDRALPDGNVLRRGRRRALCGDTLFGGYRLRSEFRAHGWVGKAFGCRVIPFELVDPYYYHLDTCFCPLAPGVAIYYPAAFDKYAATVLRDIVPELIEVSRVETQRFACNAVVIGRTVITNTGCPELHPALPSGASRRARRPWMNS